MNHKEVFCLAKSEQSAENWFATLKKANLHMLRGQGARRGILLGPNRRKANNQSAADMEREKRDVSHNFRLLCYPKRVRNDRGGFQRRRKMSCRALKRGLRRRLIWDCDFEKKSALGVVRRWSRAI